MLDVSLGPGDWLDRFTVLLVKLVMSPAKADRVVQQLKDLQADENVLTVLEKESVAGAMAALLKIHFTLWGLEDQARIPDIFERDDLLSSAYREIAQLNEDRAKWKAQVDETFAYLGDVKVYLRDSGGKS